MPQALKFIGNNADGSPRKIQTKLLKHHDVISYERMICELSGLTQPIRFKKCLTGTIHFVKKIHQQTPFIYSPKGFSVHILSLMIF